MNQSWLLLALVALLPLSAVRMIQPENRPLDAPLPERVLVGYWHNFAGGAGFMPLREVSEAFDVVNISFAMPSAGSTAQMVFVPDAATTVEAFKADVRLLQDRGQKVLISIGGATATVRLETQADAEAFTTSMIQIIEAYGFDGLDIDLEGHSLALNPGDTDFRAPFTPVVVNFIDAVRAIAEHFGDDFIVTAAPETAYVQGGFNAYGDIWGAYLPVLHALRDRLTLLHVQHYNTGTMFGVDGVIYQPATADFHVAMAEMLLQGFPVAHNDDHFFPPFRPDQVAIGLPAVPPAAGSGYTPPAVVHEALDYLITGKSFGGDYRLRQSAGYPGFRGLMTWSINWDAFSDSAFSGPHRAYLDALGPATGTHATKQALVSTFDLYPGAPNPFSGHTSVRYVLSSPSDVRLAIYDTSGREVVQLVQRWQDAGVYEVPISLSSLPSGIYYCRLTAAGTTITRTMTLAR